jgi:hypothetical protein
MNPIRVRVNTSLKKVIKRMGYDVTRVSPDEIFHPDMEAEFRDLYDRCCETMTRLEGVYALYTSVGHVCKAKVPGAVVACGVFKGGTSMMCAMTMQAHGETRDLYMYDTFGGMTPPGKRDRLLAPGTPTPEDWETYQRDGWNEWCYAPLEEVKQNLAKTGYPEEHLRYVVGPVQETIPTTIPERISVLRLDTLFYESTRHELEHLYPLVSSGGIVIIDDYGTWGGAKQAVDEYFEDKKSPVIKIDVTTRLVVKP